MVIALLIVSVSLFLFIEVLVAWLNRTAEEKAEPQTVKGFSDVHLPRGLFLGNGHTWARLTESGELKVGIDEFLAQAVDGADRVDLPQPGTEVKKGQPLATLWRLNHKLVVPSPVDGTVVASNETADRIPKTLEFDPYGSGWLAKVWPIDHKEAIGQLRVGEQAFKWLEREIQRFAEFLALRSAPKLVGATLPDGARPIVGAALTLDEQAWNEFEKEFLTDQPQ